MAPILSVAGADFVFHMLVAGNYGYFRDELYYIVSGQHLQLGYVDFPGMIAYLAALMNVLAGDGLVAIHVIPALAGAALVFVSGMMARELGGKRWAQVLAAVATLVTAQLALASIFSMDILDALWWSVGSYILIRLTKREEPRLWVLFGLVTGLGLMTKLTIVFFLLALIVALVLTDARRNIRSRWFWTGAAVAFLFLLPYVAWNVMNGWPTVDFYIHHGGLNGSGPADFVVSQVVIANPAGLPLVIAGLYFLLRSPSGAPFRFLGVALVLLFSSSCSQMGSLTSTRPRTRCSSRRVHLQSNGRPGTEAGFGWACSRAWSSSVRSLLHSRCQCFLL
jgi:4-amino-4-deoxy-L-arabinose transferase-like glycosyltransferase